MKSTSIAESLPASISTPQTSGSSICADRGRPFDDTNLPLYRGYNDEHLTMTWAGSGSARWTMLYLDTSRGSGVYKVNGHVTPCSIKTLLCIKY